MEQSCLISFFQGVNFIIVLWAEYLESVQISFSGLLVFYRITATNSETKNPDFFMFLTKFAATADFQKAAISFFL